MINKITKTDTQQAFCALANGKSNKYSFQKIAEASFVSLIMQLRFMKVLWAVWGWKRNGEIGLISGIKDVYGNLVDKKFF